MSSHFPIEIAAVALLALGACDRLKDETTQMPVARSGPQEVVVTDLVPGGQPPSGMDRQSLPYFNNAKAVMDGKRLYNWYNCVGCHANGGGAIGPALMDDQWIYGDRLDQIYASIYQGRPNGMPAWGHKIPEQQIWQIAAYVRSMSLPETIAAGKGQTPSQKPAPLPAVAGNDSGWTPPPETRTEAP
jgi:cytochrome c oxidase cbb3-type subunit 3